MNEDSVLIALVANAVLFILAASIFGYVIAATWIAVLVLLSIRYK